MKPATKLRRALLATCVAGATLASTGCSSGGFSMASVNPFSKPTPNLNATPGITDSIASSTKSIGGSAKNALTKTTDAFAGVFRRDDSLPTAETATDPLSLSNRPAKVGPEVFVANGQLWESTGELGKAMESYTKALESEPNNPPALTSIARLHFRQGNHQQAVEFFDRAISQTPDDAGLHNDLGLTHSRLGNYAGANASLSKALDLAPGTSRYANNLASVRFESGDSNSAYQVLSTNNKPAVAHFNMAYLHFKNGQLTDARGHLSQAMLFEQEAEQDVAVKRAVDRSRDMLAQIDASMGPVAQAAPQASIAGGRFLTQNPSVQQTSQSGASNGSVAPAAPTVPTSTPSGTLGVTATPAIAAMPTAPAASATPSAEIGGPSFPFSMPGAFPPAGE
ncbi:MAG: tetratricopeptide repeat protein [Rubripirellula sp.]